MTKYVVVDQSDGAIFCLGIYKNYYTALGRVMAAIEDFKDSYRDEGDAFKIGDLYDLECDGGVCIRITYKAACWSKECFTEYYILVCEGAEEDDEP